MWFSLLAASVACLSLAQYPGSVAPPAELAKGFNTITVNDSKRVLTYLATECEGRGTGQPGFEKAAQFVAKQFHSLGLKPLGDDGTYFQKADFTRWRFDPAATELKLNGVRLGGREINLRSGAPDIKLNSQVVFMTAPTGRFTADTKFTNQIVLIKIDRRSMALENAIIDRGADAVLTIVPTTGEPSWRPRMGMNPPTVRPGIAGTISADSANKLVSALSEDAPQVAQLDGGFQVSTYAGKATLDSKLVIEHVKVGNVVAMLPGSDPALASEYVGVGGHLDHLGINDGVVFPGADDDGSGSTAVIEVARAMVANPLKPKRSIVFMTFFGEEMGLLGSSFLTAHPPVPLDHMVAELQMDMVGRDSDGVQNGDPNRVDVASENVDTIRLVGSKRISTELDKDIQEENQFIGFKFKYDAEDVYTRSDHYNFAAKGVPIAFLFDGFHPDYHRPTDTVDKIDWEKLTNAAKLYYLTAHRVADSPAPPAKDVHS